MFWTIAGGVCLGILAAYRIIHATREDRKSLGGIGIILTAIGLILICIGGLGYLTYYLIKNGNLEGIPKGIQIIYYIIVYIIVIFIYNTIKEIFKKGNKDIKEKDENKDTQKGVETSKNKSKKIS